MVGRKRLKDKPCRHCAKCGKIIRPYNKSGLCQYHAQQEYYRVHKSKHKGTKYVRKSNIKLTKEI